MTWRAADSWVSTSQCTCSKSLERSQSPIFYSIDTTPAHPPPERMFSLSDRSDRDREIQVGEGNVSGWYMPAERTTNRGGRATEELVL